MQLRQDPAQFLQPLSGVGCSMTPSTRPDRAVDEEARGLAVGVAFDAAVGRDFSCRA